MAAFEEGKIDIVFRIKREQGKILKICKAKHFLRFRLKGRGHAILGNFSTDQIVIELT